MRKIFLAHVFFTITICYGIINLVAMDFSGLELLTTFIGVFLLVWVSTYVLKQTYFYGFKAVINLALYFLKEVIVSNFRIIYFILSAGHKFRPAILQLPLDLKSNFGITLLANLITLTPGTITLEVSEDKKYLYFHIVNVPEENIEKAKQKIKNGFEKRILKIES